MQAAQPLPRGEERERLRAKGQFWTPPWVARAMVAFVLGGGARAVFDPAVGPGTFLVEAAPHARVAGYDVDPEVLRAAGAAVPGGLALRDFLRDPPAERFEAIVANPPYVRHHRLGAARKAELRALAVRVLGFPLDGRTGLHVFFLVQALDRLAPDGRLAFVLPADAFEGRSAGPLWAWIAARYRLDAAVTFDPAATPFPGVDTNAVVVFLSAGPPRTELAWAWCGEASGAFEAWVRAGFPPARSGAMDAGPRDLAEALATGLSRRPSSAEPAATLGDLVRVRRGVATGANAFFLFTRAQLRAPGLPESAFVRTVPRTRDVPGDAITEADLERLDAAGRPTFLLSLPGQPASSLPPEVREHLARGERLGLPQRPLLATRRPWYRMEVREPPPFLFAYLGRRRARFLRNDAGVVPLTSFLCVYPRESDPAHVEALGRLLRDPAVLANLRLVAKSYGGGALKVEPRALERVPLSTASLGAAGLGAYATGLEREGRLVNLPG